MEVSINFASTLFMLLSTKDLIVVFLPLSPLYFPHSYTPLSFSFLSMTFFFPLDNFFLSLTFFTFLNWKKVKTY